jgi:chromosome segregation ATPase
MSDQRNIAELERRITAALGRIGAGLDKWEAKPGSVPQSESQSVPRVEPSAETRDEPGAGRRAERGTELGAELGAIIAALDTGKAAPAKVDTADAPSDLAAQLAESKGMIAELEAEIARLKSDLATEKSTVAQLTEHVKAIKEADNMSQGQVDAKVEKMTQQLDVQGLELQRMRKSSVQLRENLRVLHEAATKNMVEPQLINRAMLAELENLRATRHTETAEMDEILAELKPLISEARSNG